MPQAGQDGAGAAAPGRRGRPGAASTTTGPHGGYAALRRAFELGPAGVIREVPDVRPGRPGRRGLPHRPQVGRRPPRQPDRPHYLVCNADESEPGTFKDRVLMEGDPYALIEAMTIAGYAIGAAPRLPLPARRVPARAAPPGARDRPAARARGLLGDDVLGPGLRLRHRDPARRRRLHLRRGDRDLQLDRGLPRRAAQQAAVPGREGPVRQADGGEQRRDAGQRAADPDHGRRGVRGDRHRAAPPAPSCSASPAPCAGRASTSCRSAPRCGELLDLAGGVPEGRRCGRCCSAARPAAFVRPDELDIPLTFEGTREAGATLGSGVVLVLDDTRRRCRGSCCASPSSSATSPAGSACRAGSAPCARRRRCTGSRERTGAAATRRHRPAARGRPRRCATPRSAASGRPRGTPSSRPSTVWGCSRDVHATQ